MWLRCKLDLAIEEANKAHLSNKFEKNIFESLSLCCFKNSHIRLLYLYGRYTIKSLYNKNK